MTRYRWRGTHGGEFRGIAPTGGEQEINGIGIFRFSPEGKVVESWDSYDQFSLMRQSIEQELRDRKSTRLNSSHANISYAVFCLKKKKKKIRTRMQSVSNSQTCERTINNVQVEC